MPELTDICENCGLTYGSHSAGTKPYPTNTCPATEGNMDFAEGPGTTFRGEIDNE